MREVFPLLVCELTSVWFFSRFFPRDEAFNWADFFAFPPVQFAMPGLVESHDGVAFPLGCDARDELVGTEGSVTENHVSFVDVFQEAWCDPGVVLLEAAGLESFDPAVAEVDHADDAHDGKSAALF